MIPYNTDYKPIRLPEYGRTIQSLIDYCVAIPDREERTACAYAIAEVMANMFPEMKGENHDYKQIWDQMQIMSQFKLDVDFPYPPITSETINPKPQAIPYTASHISHRHYGKSVEKMIRVIADMEDGPEKDELISMVAHHMKKLMLMNNKEGVEDSRILRDLELYSGGKIRLNPEVYRLHEFREAPQPQQGNKKKRKK